MRWISLICFGLLSAMTQAADMSVDQAVSRLLKDIEQVEVMKVPVPAAPEMGSKGSKQSLPASAKVQTSGTYRVRKGETLDMVIRRLAPSSPLQNNVLRQAFVKANPHAFRRGNPNWMYAGVVLKVPDVEHLRQVIFKETPGRLRKDISDQKAGWVRFP